MRNMMTRFVLIAIISVLFTVQSFASDAASVAPVATSDVILVCPSPLLPAMQPWIAHRSQQGHGVHLLSDFDDAQSLCLGIRRLVSESVRPVASVVLVGDTDRIPTVYVAADIIARHTKDPMIATDNAFGDMDDDGVPELAVGRLSVANDEELREVVAKIIAYETSLPPGEWLRRLHVVAGVGGFTAILDGMIETSTRYVFESLIPPSYRITSTMANWRSVYCPDPLLLRAMALDRLNEGGLFWMYIGHGYRKAVDTLKTPAGNFPILLQGDAAHVASREGLPIAVFFACHTGSLDTEGVSLAEDLLRRPRGPVAVIASSRVTMPYGMACLSVELAERVTTQHPATLGDLFRDSKRGMILSWKSPKPPRSLAPSLRQRPVRDMIDSTSTMFDPTASPERQRREHLHLFHLFGDPLLRLPQPQPVAIAATRRGAEVTVTGSMTEGSVSEGSVVGEVGEVIVEIVRREGRGGTVRTEFVLTEESREEYQRQYAEANDTTIVRSVVPLHNGVFETTLTLPAAISVLSRHESKDVFVRVFVTEGRRFGLAAVPLSASASIP